MKLEHKSDYTLNQVGCKEIFIIGYSLLICRILLQIVDSVMPTNIRVQRNDGNYLSFIF